MTRRSQDSESAVQSGYRKALPRYNGELRTHELYRRIKSGLRASELLRECEFGPGEEARLTRVVEEGKRARNEVAKNNLRLVLQVASRFHPTPDEIMDLVQEGNIGLLRAVEKYDLAKGFAFSTYATYWIMQAMSTWLARFRSPFSLPSNTYHLLRAVEAFGLRDSERERPVIETLAAQLGVPTHRLEKLLSATTTPLSLDAPARGRADGYLHEGIQSDSDVEAEVLGNMHDSVKSVLALLTDSERRVLSACLGLNGAAQRTISEVAFELGLNKERARQIYGRARAKISHPSAVRHLDTVSWTEIGERANGW